MLVKLNFSSNWSFVEYVIICLLLQGNFVHKLNASSWYISKKADPICN